MDYLIFNQHIYNIKQRRQVKHIFNTCQYLFDILSILYRNQNSLVFQKNLHSTQHHQPQPIHSPQKPDPKITTLPKHNPPNNPTQHNHTHLTHNQSIPYYSPYLTHPS